VAPPAGSSASQSCEQPIDDTKSAIIQVEIVAWAPFVKGDEEKRVTMREAYVTVGSEASPLRLSLIAR
jgi:hypothetical protein